MHDATQDERELRAARNQTLFRTLNEKLKELDDTLAALGDTFGIACECADPSCIQMLEIGRAEYEAVRAEPRRFAVLPGHVYPDVESVVGESGDYVVVEKKGAAGELAGLLDART